MSILGFNSPKFAYKYKTVYENIKYVAQTKLWTLEIDKQKPDLIDLSSTHNFVIFVSTWARKCVPYSIRICFALKLVPFVWWSIASAGTSVVVEQMGIHTVCRRYCQTTTSTLLVFFYYNFFNFFSYIIAYILYRKNTCTIITCINIWITRIA